MPVPGGSAASRAASWARNRRVTRCRVTLLPTERATIRPRCGCDPVSPERACTTRHPRRLRAPQRSTAANSPDRRMRYAGDSTDGEATALRRKARDDPCGAARRRWPARHGCACAAGNRASSHAVGCSAGRCACSRWNSITRNRRACADTARRMRPRRDRRGGAARPGADAQPHTSSRGYGFASRRVKPLPSCGPALRRRNGGCFRRRQLFSGPDTSRPQASGRHAAPYCRSGADAVRFADRARRRRRPASTVDGDSGRLRRAGLPGPWCRHACTACAELCGNREPH